MRLRARHIQHVEILTDNITGLFINYWLAILTFNWLLGQDISHSQNLAASVVFFIAAYVRKYFWRRTFSNWIKRVYDRRAKEDAGLQEQARAD